MLEEYIISYEKKLKSFKDGVSDDIELLVYRSGMPWNMKPKKNRNGVLDYHEISPYFHAFPGCVTGYINNKILGYQ